MARRQGPPHHQWGGGRAAQALERKPAGPDLFLFGLLGSFRGYYPGYSRDIARDGNHFTWAVLQAHTHNTAAASCAPPTA